MKPILLVFALVLSASAHTQETNVSPAYLNMYYHALRIHIEFVEKSYCPGGGCTVNVVTNVNGLPPMIDNLHVKYIKNPRPKINESMYIVRMDNAEILHDTVIVRISDMTVRVRPKLFVFRGGLWWANSGGSTIVFTHNSTGKYVVADIQRGWL